MLDDEVRRLNDPHCPLADIVGIAHAHPRLHRLAAGHPGADGQLLHWLATTSPDPAAREIAGGRIASAPQATQSAPSPGRWVKEGSYDEAKLKRSPALIVLAALGALLVIGGGAFGIAKLMSTNPEPEPTAQPTTQPSATPAAERTTEEPTAAAEPTPEPTDEPDPWPSDPVIPANPTGHYSDLRITADSQPIEGLGPFEEHFDTDAVDPYVSHNTDMFEVRDGKMVPLFGGSPDPILRVNDSLVTFGNYELQNKYVIDMRTNEEVPIPQEVDGLLLYFPSSIDTDLILAYYKDAAPTDMFTSLSERRAFVAYDRQGGEVWRMTEDPAPGCAMGKFTAEWGSRFAQMREGDCRFVLDQHTGTVYDDTRGAILSQNSDAIFTASRDKAWIYPADDFAAVESYEVEGVKRIDAETEEVRDALKKLEENPLSEPNVQILAGGNAVGYSYDSITETVEWAGTTYTCADDPYFIDYGRQMICPGTAGGITEVWEKGADTPIVSIPQAHDGPYLTRFNSDQWLMQNYVDYAYPLKPAM